MGDIIIDTAIRNKFCEGFDRGCDIDTIILHQTGGGGTYNYVLSGARSKEYLRGIGLFHYLIEKKGARIIEIIDPNKWVYHSSRGRADKTTIGIEIENFSKDNSALVTDEQYEAFFGLIDDLVYRYPTIKKIMSHSRSYVDFCGANKPFPPCPGDGFDWLKLEGTYDLKKISNECYEI